jgi:hypothetical protein
MSTTDKGWLETIRLMHFGVKGMRWGVRRDRTPRGVTVTPRGRKRLKAVGGENQPASSEAIRTKSLGQVARKSGYQALTNDDLKKYNERLNLEANAKRLNYQQKSSGQKFVATMLGRGGKNLANQAADEASSVAIKKLLKKGAVTAAAAAV